MSDNSDTTKIVLNAGTTFAELDGDRLTIGNDLFRRAWRIAPTGLLYPESFFDAVSGREWCRASAELPAPTPATQIPEERRTLEFSRVSPPSVIEADSLTAELTATGERATLIYSFQVFPDMRGVRMRLRAFGGTQANEVPETELAEPIAAPTGVELDEKASDSVRGERDRLDGFALAPLHLRLSQIIFHDQTDVCNELVFQNEWLLHTAERPLPLEGCLFSVEDTLTGSGLIFLKEAPLPSARPNPSPYDLLVNSAERSVAFVGQGADATGEGYTFVTLAYDGGAAGRTAALHGYQRALRPYQPGRDGMHVSNTWGDRNRDGRINAEFMAQEIEAGARLGVDIIQIDDGWERGATLNSIRAKTQGGVWEGFYAAQDDFWAVNEERFPDGLEPLLAMARAKGLRFGLWFGPDSAGDFANWRRDADTIIRLHQDFGIENIKIDGVKLRSKPGERNLQAFFDAVLTETAEKVVFDLDITAENRPGYFGMMGVGPLFVENRYTDWRRYWPHQTLRNLWKLAHYIDPVRLRMEWLNHARNTEKYADDPLAPAAYRPDYLFATVMFAAPLGWFEVSNLPESYFTEAAPLIEIWKAHRDAIYRGTILPIGDAPDGTSWTGFISVASDNQSVYVLLFREWNDFPTKTLALPSSSLTGEGAIVSELLGGEGVLEGRGDTITATIPHWQRFLFARLIRTDEVTIRPG